MFRSGDLFDGYRVLREVGRGSYGTVFEAENELTHRRCALKALPLHGRGAERELRALELCREIVSPALIPIYHARIHDDMLCYTMAWAEGGTLSERHFSAEELLAVARKLLSGLEELHRAGLLHRDIKPDNVFIFHGEPVLGDLGLLCETAPGASLLGTPEFLPPECLAGREPIGERADLYALGMTIYVLLSGNAPGRFPEYGGPADRASATLLAAVLAVCSPGSAIRTAADFRKLLEPDAPPARTGGIARRAGAIAAAAIVLAAAVGYFAVIHHAGSSPKKTAPRVVTAGEVAAAMKKLAADNAPSAEFIRLQARLEAERNRLWAEKTARAQAARRRPMTPEEVAAAARDPRRGATDAEFFIRTGRFDEAAAAFDREHSDNKVIAYFETAEALTVQWNKFSHLATLTTLGNTDFSADLKKIVSLYEKRKRLEAELVQQYRDAPFAP